MWLASILFINTLTLLTIADTDRGRPTLKVKDERFRNRLFRDLHNRTLMCTRSNLCLYRVKLTIETKLTMNAKLTMNINVMNTMLCVSLNCSNDMNRSTKNVDEAKLQVTAINAVLLLTEDTRHYINAVWKLYVKCIEVTLLIFMTCCIFVCIALCITNDVQNKGDVIQEFIVSSVSLYNNILSILHEQWHVSTDINSESTLPSINPASFDIVPVYENAKSSQLSEQVSADIDTEILNTKHFRSRYAKFIVIGVNNRHVCRRDQ